MISLRKKGNKENERSQASPPRDVQSNSEKVQKYLSSMKSSKLSGLFKQKHTGSYNFIQETPASTSQEKYTVLSDSDTPQIASDGFRKRKLQDEYKEPPVPQKKRKVD